MWKIDTGILPHFFIGEVVNKDDPTNSGRVKVRVAGMHPQDPPTAFSDKDEKDEVFDDDLPWAPCVDGTYGNMQGLPDEGDFVFGFFADGRDAQHPMCLGTIPGMNSDDAGAAGNNPASTQQTGSTPTNTGPTTVPPSQRGEAIDTDNDIVEIIETGPGYNIVRMEDGTIVRNAGDRNWRNNNPGNLEYNEYTRSLGAIGTDGRFAIFPNKETGRAAKETLLFENRNYRNLTLDQAINRYAPQFENNTSAYIANVASASGIAPGTRMGDIPADRRAAVLDAFERQEGFREGTRTVVSEGTA